MAYKRDSDDNVTCHNDLCLAVPHARGGQQKGGIAQAWNNILGTAERIK